MLPQRLIEFVFLLHRKGDPISLHELALEMLVPVVVITIWWHLGLSLRGMSRKKDGPLSTGTIIWIVTLWLAMCTLLAVLNWAENKRLAYRNGGEAEAAPICADISLVQSQRITTEKRRYRQ